MYGNRYVVAKYMIVQHIYGEEQDDIDQPAAYRHSIRLEEMRRSASIELRDESGDGHKEELDER